MTSRAVPIFPLTLLLCVAVSCGPPERTTDTTASPTPAAPTPAATPSPAAGLTAVAELTALGTSGVTGRITFTEDAAGVRVEAHVNGLAPGEHGFHVHEWGDCSAPDGTSAGAHFNPTGDPHGAMDPATPHHAGDLGNLTADASGHATMTATTTQFTLSPGAKSILGRAVIVHEKRDDLATQPAGDAGGRVACGVVRQEGAETAPVLAGSDAAGGATPAPSPALAPGEAGSLPTASPTP